MVISDSVKRKNCFNVAIIKDKKLLCLMMMFVKTYQMIVNGNANSLISDEIFIASKINQQTLTFQP